MASSQVNQPDEWEDVEWEDEEPAPTKATTTSNNARIEAPKGLLSRAWSAISEPLTTAPSEFARSVANTVDAPSLERSPLVARAQGFLGGALEGIGDLVSGITSPLGIASTVIPGGQAVAGARGLTRTAKALNAAGKVVAAPAVAHGGSTILDPDTTWGEKGMGLVEIAGGIAGAKGRTPEGHPLPKVTKESPVASKEIKVNPPGVQSTVADKAPAIKPGTMATLKAATPERIKEMQAAGWEFAGLTDDGKFRMRMGTKKATEQPVLESEVGGARPTPSGAREHLGELTDVKKNNPYVEAANFPRAVMASFDMSAPLRQGLPLIHKKAFWTSLDDMVKSWGSETAFDAVQASIAERPLFKKRVGPDNKVLPSFAEDAGLKLTDLTDLTSREEAVMSTWAEKIPGVRRSNRAYTAFLNKLRADTFEQLVKDGKIFGADAGVDLPRARALAEFVNYASGRGSLGKAERAAVILNSTFFAPRLIASRLKFLNPTTYVTGDKMARKEAIKSLLALTAAGNTVIQLGKMAGAEVENDPGSSDFGKLKIGNVRLDPWAGFQQYVVAANRILRPREARIESFEGGADTGIAPIDMATGWLGAQGGKFKSSVSGSEYFLGEKYGGSSRLDVAGRFLEGKANPIINFATGLLRGKDLAGQPFNVPEETAKRFVPIFVQDFKELLTENPNLIPGINEEGVGDNIYPENLPAAIPSFFGMGMQRYGNE